MEEDRDADGTFSAEHTDDEFVAAVRAHEPAATSEVADEVGMTRQGADRRLRRLRDEGRVNSKKIGASLVWFPVDAGGGGGVPDEQAAESAPTPAETEPVEQEDPEVDPAPEDASGEQGDVNVSEDVRRAVDLAAAGVETNDKPAWEDDDRLADRKAAARAVLAYAVEQGERGERVSKSEAQERFLPAHSVDEQDANSWWQQNAKRPLLSEIGAYSRGRGYLVTADDVAAWVAENDGDADDGQ